MHLKTLGELTLENSPLTERLPLLLLSYLALEGKTHRQALADLFWIHQPGAKKRLQGLSETLYRLKKIDKTLVVLEDNYVSTRATVDAKTFEKEKDIHTALALYRGPFLANLERSKRLKLGEELTEWILNKREVLQTRALNLHLEFAEELAFASKFEEAANAAWQAFTASTAIAYPNQEVYRRTHTFLLAAEQLERARALQQEVAELYGEHHFPLDQPFKARAYLTHTFNLRPENENLIDRDKDIEALLGLLEGSRFITIYGPAGVGKTVLVQALARVARGKTFAKDGIHIAYFENLSEDASFDALMRLIAEALGMAPSGKTLTLEDLSNFIADQAQLLILDNLEHVTKEATRIVKHLHDTCKALRIVTTSRQHLKLSHETLYALRALSFPAPDEPVTLETIRAYGAVSLFERDAKKFGFELADDSLTDIIKVCQMVEGLPLALKLAAAWTNTLTPRQIVQELEKDIDVLGEGTHDTPRHSSIRATFDHSLALLSEQEAKGLIALGVFEDGFTLEAARKVTGADVFMLRQLLEKSLLRFDIEKSRYDFYPLFDRYIKGFFQKREDKDALEAEHACYYLALLDTVIDEEGNERGEVLPALKLEMENIEKAWRYATDHTWHEELFRSSRALQNFSTLAVQYLLADKLLTYSLEKAPEDAVNLRIALTANLSAIKYWLGNHEKAVNLALSAYKLLSKGSIEAKRTLSIIRLIFSVLQASYSTIGKFADSLRVAGELVQILREKAHGTPAFGHALANSAIHERDILGKYDVQPFYEALSIAETQTKTDLPWLLVNLSESLFMIGEIDEAEKTVVRAKNLAEQMGQPHWLVMSQHRLAIIKLFQAKIWEALEIVYPLLERVKKHRKPSLTTIIYQLAGQIEMARGNSQTSWDFYMKALSEVSTINNVTLANSIKVDILEWMIRQQDRLASQLQGELKNEIARMYVHDQERFNKLVQEHSPSD